MIRDPGLARVIVRESEERTLPSGFSSVVPDLIGKVAAEKPAGLFGPWILAVEETTGGEVIGLIFRLELLVRNE